MINKIIILFKKIFKSNENIIHINPNDLMIKDISTSLIKEPKWAIIIKSQSAIFSKFTSYKDALETLWEIQINDGFDIVNKI